jgi:aspartate kinase
LGIIVQKYGGSSLADVSRLQKVAERVASARAGDQKIVVVVSAMGDTTDALLKLARTVCGSPKGRELDMLLSAGERISMALLSMALNARDIPAVSFTGSQSGIITDQAHTNARIVEVRPQRVEEELARGRVVIVAGYQGVSREREITTLGRGGSDTTAVALAAALGAEACEIYSDVEGVFTADPRTVPGARPLKEISYDEMQELAEAGARVLNAQAVEFAKERGVVIHARSTHGGSGETVIRGRPEADRVVGVATQAVFHIEAPPEGADGSLPTLLRVLEAHEAPVGHLVSSGPTLVVALPSEGLSDPAGLRRSLARELPGTRVREDLGTLSVVGAGQGARATLARIVAVLAPHIQGVLSAPLRTSVLLDAARLEDAARTVHTALVR